MENYAKRCAGWLEQHADLAAAVIEKEIQRFNRKLSAAEARQPAITEEVDDLLLTLDLLQSRLDAMAVVEKNRQLPRSDREGSPDGADTVRQETVWDTSPLQDLTVRVEVLDVETREKRLDDLLQHDLLRKGFPAS